MRSSVMVFCIASILGSIRAQEPAPAPQPEPPVLVPPAPAPPAPPATTAPPRRAARARLAAPVPQPPSLSYPAQDEKAAQDASKSLEEAMSVDRLLDEAVEVTKLDRDQLRPAIKALRATWSSTPYAVKAPGRSSLRVYSSSRIAGASEAAEKDLAEAVSKLPYEKQEAFVKWASTKRREVAELGAVFAETVARGSLRSVLEGQQELESARRELETWRRLPSEKEWERMAEAGKTLAQHEKQLAEARRTLTEHESQLAKEMELLARARIEGALDKSLWDRHRDLAACVDAEKSRELVEQLARARTWTGTDTQPASGIEGLEKQLGALRERRQALDEAIERATTELVRERAARLHEEALKREQEEKAKLRGEVQVRQNVQAEPAGDVEVRQLREELKRLRQEVDALRKANKAPKEPKEPK